jgi:transposase
MQGEVSTVELVVPRCAGLDVAKDEVVACVRVPDGRGGRRQEVRTYPTFTSGLEALADWLAAEAVTQVVMEATGQYWKPVWYVLEERGFQLLLVNARHVKIVPGRKTDVADAAWLAELLEHGLLRGSFVPPAPIRELRDLTRYRKRLIQAHTAEVQRVQKSLEDAGIKLDSVATDVLGASGRAMLTALVAGERDPEVLAELARGRLRSKLPQLRQALRGRFGDHHALLLRLALAHLEHLEGAIAALDRRVDEVIAPFARARDRLDTITGVGKRAAETIIAEIGVDMTVFPTAAHLASWAGRCPGNNLTGGKRRSGKPTRGNRWLGEVLIECAWAAARSRDTYLSAQYWRLARRIGKKKAAVAVGHSILVIAWYLLTDNCDYQDLGGDYFVRRDTERARQRAVAQLQASATASPSNPSPHSKGIHLSGRGRRFKSSQAHHTSPDQHKQSLSVPY